MTTCLIALGGNLGDVPAAFSRAMELLAGDGVRVAGVSGVVRSAAMGSAAGAEFFNAAARLEVSLSPAELLARLHEVEAVLDRTREVRWGPRTIDLDLITHGMACSGTTSLMLPHPGCWWRRFVLDPVVEIAGDVVHPATGETFLKLRERLRSRPFVVEIPKEMPREWIAGVIGRIGSLGGQVKWTSFDDAAAIRFVPGSMMNSPVERLLGVPGEMEGFVDAASAILTAAVNEPVVVDE